MRSSANTSPYEPPPLHVQAGCPHPALQSLLLHPPHPLGALTTRPPVPDPVAPLHPEPAPPAGTARLEVAHVDGLSAVIRAFASSPLKLLVPRPRGSSVWIFTSSFGGGLVAGDQTSLDLRLAPGTTAFVGTQASNKVYRNPDARPSGHSTSAHVGRDAFLAFTPDPTQLFALATYRQRQEFLLEPGASLALVDSFTPGRMARGEAWSFNHFSSRNLIRTPTRTLCLDSLRLDPADGPLADPFRGGRHGCFSTLVLVGPRLRDAAQLLLSEVASCPVTNRALTVVAASPLADGVIARIAGANTEAVGTELRRWLAPLSSLLGDDPWQRKW